MDEDGSGDIQLEEFVNAYYHEQRRLEEEIEELEYRIHDAQMRGGQIQKKLDDLRQQERVTNNRHFKYRDRFIMVGSILSVHVIDARDLVAARGGQATALVKL